MDIYSEELIAYKVNSCIDGEIKGSFEIIKAPIDILKVAEEAQDYDYNFWRKYWEKEIAHDFYSDEYFESRALKRIVADIKYIYASSNKQSAFYMAEKLPCRNTNV